MKFSSKARTLKKLKLNSAIVPKLFIFTVFDFKKKKTKILKNISKSFKKNIAIRSSSIDEDNATSSNAGKFLSFLNINPKNHKLLSKKITEVIKSYKNNNSKNEIFIQEMVNNIEIAGVILTRNLKGYSECFNVNYSEDSNSSTVTSGKHGTKNLIFYENKKYKIPKKFLKIYKIVRKLKKRFKSELDIEFIIDKSKKIYILQVRKLVIPNDLKLTSYSDYKTFKGLNKKINKLKKRHYSLGGKTTHFGVMPDWNPAEIIGIKPKPLALSLYQELVTDHVWAENRKLYGYKDLNQFHLMTTFFGTPFIDVRVDFNSWIPKNLNKKLSEKIINYYLEKFRRNNNLHDKVEFQILFTCFNLSTNRKINNNLNKILNKNERNQFIDNLKLLNKTALTQQKNDLILLKELKIRQKKIINSDLYYIDKIYWIIEDCKKYGTLPFAGLARCAFIATEILNSFVEEKILTDEEKIIFLSTIKTITTEMNEDLNKSKDFFIKKYGHLRPGTYEITSKNYRSNFNLYFNKHKRTKKIKNLKFKFSERQKLLINKFIKNSNIYSDFNELINFIKDSIKYREYSKFVFTKSIDLIFENLERLGKKYKIKKDDLSYLDIQKILNIYFNYSNFKSIESLKVNINQNKSEYFKNHLINLPDVITSDKDLYIQRREESKINFISNKIITAKILDFKLINLRKKINEIICIENADPGYDFLFSKNIRGLITKYGGQNSHMAIRCAELNLPALIGVGEELYNKIIQNKYINIDCVQNKIELIR